MRHFKSVNILFFCFFIFLVSASYPLRSNPKYITKSKQYYIVKRGDNLTKISRETKVPLQKIRLFNNLKKDKIFVGQKIYLIPKNNGKNNYVTQKPIPQKKYHLVKKGDTLYRLSKIYGIDVIDLVEINEMQSFQINVGQKIWLEKKKVKKSISSPKKPSKPTISSSKKYYHKVKRGENLTRIARKYGMSLAEIKTKNKLKKDKILVGQRLLVNQYKGKHSTSTKATITTSSKTKLDLQAPIKGPILSPFGMRNGILHKGIDIGGETGEQVSAAADGQVVFAGQQRGYGNIIILEHKQMIMTVYAHNETNLVRLGDTVKKGQPIAALGQTGNASAPHVHFEYRHKGKAMNPEKYIQF